ncbi:MAG: ECF-type sigma factor [Luteimonas sp.]|nr:ECF-type sigma factor [Luteimonas sp.]
MDQDITQWLRGDSGDNPEALSRVFTVLYDELKQLANARLRGQDSTLTPTALVNEAWLRLCGHEGAWSLENRKHFFASAAQAMRWIVVDHARRRQAERRGGAVVMVALDDDAGLTEMRPEELLALDGALDALGRLDPARRELVELRYFAGLEFDELAVLLGRSSRTLKRDWAAARAVLYALMA